MAFAQLSLPALHAARPSPPAARGAARLAAPQRPPLARFSSRLAAKRNDDRFESAFASRSELAYAYVCADCGCAS